MSDIDAYLRGYVVKVISHNHVVMQFNTILFKSYITTKQILPTSSLLTVQCMMWLRSFCVERYLISGCTYEVPCRLGPKVVSQCHTLFTTEFTLQGLLFHAVFVKSDQTDC